MAFPPDHHYTPPKKRPGRLRMFLLRQIVRGLNRPGNCECASYGHVLFEAATIFDPKLVKTERDFREVVAELVDSGLIYEHSNSTMIRPLYDLIFRPTVPTMEFLRDIMVTGAAVILDQTYGNNVLDMKRFADRADFAENNGFRMVRESLEKGTNGLAP